VLTKTYTISCDTTGCTTKPISYSAPAGDVGAPGTLRHMAAVAGWHRQHGVDACKLHVNELDPTDPHLHINIDPTPKLSVDIGHSWRGR
jgi:hypothetical protein